MLNLDKEHLARAASRALTGQGDPPVILVEGLGLLDRDTVSRTIVAIGPALLAGDHDRALDLAASALRPLPVHPEPAAVTMRDIEARAFVSWLVGLVAQAALNHPLRGRVELADDPRVICIEDDGRPIMHLTIDDNLHFATLRPSDRAGDWLIDTHAAYVQIACTQLHDLDLPTAISMVYAVLHVLAATGPGSSTTPCFECELPIPDDAPAMVDPAHAASCSLHPWASVPCTSTTC